MENAEYLNEPSNDSNFNPMEPYGNYLACHHGRNSGLSFPRLQGGGDNHPPSPAGDATLWPDRFSPVVGSPGFTAGGSDHEVFRGHDCPRCGAHFKDMNEYLYHLIDKKTAHKEIYMCNIYRCYKRFENFGDLFLHSGEDHKWKADILSMDAPPSIRDLELQYLRDYLRRRFNAEPATYIPRPQKIKKFDGTFFARCTQCGDYQPIHVREKIEIGHALLVPKPSTWDYVTVLAETSEGEYWAMVERFKQDPITYKVMMAEKALFRWIQHSIACYTKESVSIAPGEMRMANTPQPPQSNGQDCGTQGMVTRALIKPSSPPSAVFSPATPACLSLPSPRGRRRPRTPRPPRNRLHLQPRSLPPPPTPSLSKPPHHLPPPSIPHPPTSPPILAPLSLTPSAAAHSGMISPISPAFLALCPQTRLNLHPEVLPAEKRYRKRRKATKLDACYWCTFCDAHFTNCPNWKRHEADFHIVIAVYDCGPAGVLDEVTGDCNYCGASKNDPVCKCLAKAGECIEKKSTFPRKDHLLQHLRTHGMSKVLIKERSPIFDSWKREVVDPPASSRCGFCGKVFGDWTARMTHVAREFRNGKKMAEWIGDWGLDEVWALRVRNNRNGYDVILPQDRT